MTAMELATGMDSIVDEPVSIGRVRRDRCAFLVEVGAVRTVFAG